MPHLGVLQIVGIMRNQAITIVVIVETYRRSLAINNQHYDDLSKKVG